MPDAPPDAPPDEQTADARLRKRLGGDPPPSVHALSDADKDRLTDLITQARRRQAKSLEESFEATLQHVPFAVRRIVKKVLLG